MRRPERYNLPWQTPPAKRSTMDDRQILQHINELVDE